MAHAIMINSTTEYYTPAKGIYPRSWKIYVREYAVQPGIFKWVATDPSGLTLTGYERSESMCLEEAKYAIDHAND